MVLVDGELTGRIIKGVGGFYEVDTGKAVYTCPARGLFRLQNITPLVGDRVTINSIDEEKKTGYVMLIHDRTNQLVRPRVANIDIACITFAARQPAVQLILLDMLLVQAQQEDVTPLIVINKMDIAKDDTPAYIKSAYEKIGYPVFLVSAERNQDIEPLTTALQGKTCLFMGPSGVGKSSIINALSDTFKLHTGVISQKSQRGKHTTRHTSLLKLSEETYIVDSPGFSRFDTTMDADILWHCYPEFVKRANQCEYDDCLHYKENDCAVKDAVGKEIDRGRYERYIYILEKQLSPHR